MMRVMILDSSEQWIAQISDLLIDTLPKIQIIAHSLDGSNGLSKVLRLMPDLVLVNCLLPDINGIEVARRIKAISKSVKIIIYSSYFLMKCYQELPPIPATDTYDAFIDLNEFFSLLPGIINNLYPDA